MENLVLESRKDEPVKDFIGRVSQMARAFNKNVDGIYDGSYIANVSPQDNPEEVYVAYERARGMYLKQMFTQD